MIPLLGADALASFIRKRKRDSLREERRTIPRIEVERLRVPC